MPRRLAGLVWVAVALGGCGARTGLETGGPSASIDAGRLDGGRDVGLDVGRSDVSIPDGGLDVPRCPFDFDETVPGTLRLSTDDQARIFLHGELLDDRARIWSEIAIYDVPVFRHPGHANVIAIEGTNVFRIDGRDRGVLSDLSVATDIGVQTLVTDERWRLQVTEEPGWFDVEHDETGWRAPTAQGRHPIGPWGAIFGVSDAAWLWSYDSNVPASAKPEGEVVFVRRRFFVDLGGRIVDGPTPCP